MLDFFLHDVVCYVSCMFCIIVKIQISLYAVMSTSLPSLVVHIATPVYVRWTPSLSFSPPCFVHSVEISFKLEMGCFGLYPC